MINFNFYSEDAFALYKKAVETKSDKEVKTNLKQIEKDVEGLYNDYKEAFVSNTVHLLSPSTKISDHNKKHLLSLYGSNKKIVKDIRTWLDGHNKRTYLNICPYCTLNSANTMEHILPKGNYQEYAVHALNLIPCCSECNSNKGEKLLNDKGKKVVLNLYSDVLPEVQYLFVNIEFDCKGEINFNYRLDNVNKVDNELFQVIENHFRQLHLLERFKTQAISRYTEIENGLISDMDLIDVSVCLNHLRTKTAKDAADYGKNHWMVVLKLALADSIEYKKYLLKKKGVK